MVEEDANVLATVSTGFLMRNQELLRSKFPLIDPKCFGSYSLSDEFDMIHDFFNRIPEEMWNDELFKKGGSGQDYLGIIFTVKTRKDCAGTFCSFFQHVVDPECKEYFFQEYEESENYYVFLEDTKFISELMQFDPMAFRCLSESIQGSNYELGIWAFSDRKYAEFRFKGSICRWERDTSHREFIHRARGELALRDAFYNPFLCAVEGDKSGNSLGKLGSRDVLGIIGEFLGMPRGDHLAHVRKALKNWDGFEKEWYRRRGIEPEG